MQIRYSCFEITSNLLIKSKLYTYELSQRNLKSKIIKARHNQESKHVIGLKKKITVMN